MKIYFPKKDERKTIIFDLDETLIHCNLDSTKPTDIVLNVDFPSGERMEVNY
jgi:CTD small phosphatase-like protein 2